ncbi:MAG: hypothetical protein JSV51_07675 [Candidatus Bathyarchaeota archaeon]|nr:MAG: hypothetical protein JSV51_07675 [Candidatus Bathyarchaeota archaeon]
MNDSARMAWEKVKPMLEHAGKQSQRKPGKYIPAYQWFEYLYNELQK